VIASAALPISTILSLGAVAHEALWAQYGRAIYEARWILPKLKN